MRRAGGRGRGGNARGGNARGNRARGGTGRVQTGRWKTKSPDGYHLYTGLFDATWSDADEFIRSHNDWVDTSPLETLGNVCLREDCCK
jgi:hypothetical protein